MLYFVELTLTHQHKMTLLRFFWVLSFWWSSFLTDRHIITPGYLSTPDQFPEKVGIKSINPKSWLFCPALSSTTLVTWVSESESQENDILEAEQYRFLLGALGNEWDGSSLHSSWFSNIQSQSFRPRILPNKMNFIHDGIGNDISCWFLSWE
jgi:hypothetical protein